VALTLPEREKIIRALDDPPDGLAELRAVLLAEHEAGATGARLEAGVRSRTDERREDRNP
jgi:hypothetical protein